MNFKECVIKTVFIIGLFLLVSCSSSGSGSSGSEQTKEEVKKEQIVPGETVINGRA